MIDWKWNNCQIVSRTKMTNILKFNNLTNWCVCGSHKQWRQNVPGLRNKMWCNIFIYCCAPRTVTDKLQHVLNAAARVISGTRKFDRCLRQLLHDELHWLDVSDLDFFKLTVTVYQCLNGRAPSYLSDHCTPRLVHVDIYVPPTATYLQYRVIGLTPMVVGLLQSLAQRSGTVSRISSGTRQSALTHSDVCWRCICLRDTSACSALEVDNFMRYINLLTYLLVLLFVLLFLLN